MPTNQEPTVPTSPIKEPKLTVVKFNDPTLPGLEDALPAAKPRRGKSAKTEKVRVGQTAILIYWRKPDAKRKGGGWVFRYYLAGKAHVVERAKLAKAKEEALRIAVGIENGRAQTGAMSAGEAEGYFQAMNQLGKLGAAAPSLGVALNEYITAKQLLPADVSLAEAVRSFLKMNPGVGGAAVPVGDVIERFLLATADNARNPVYLRVLKADLRAFAAWLPKGLALAQVETEQIRDYLRTLKVGPRRRNNVRNEIVSLFRFAKTLNLLPEDRLTAAERVQKVKHSHEITVYQPEQMRAFLAHAQRDWIPWLVLGAFGGMRTEEIVGNKDNPGRARLRWEHFRWDKGYIVVPASVAVKVNRSRRVPLRANLLAWLLPWRNATGHVFEDRSNQMMEIRRLKRRTGLSWNANALRHSYGTNRNAELGNAGQLAEEMGTSITMIRRHYDAVPADIDPAEYFGIMPEAGAKIIPLPAQGA